MSEPTNLLNIFLAVAATAEKASEASQVLSFDNWLAIFTGVGVPLGGAVVWLTNFQKQPTDALREQYKASIENLTEVYKISTRRLNLLIQQKEAENEELKAKIKRLQDFYSINPPDPTKENSLFKKIYLNLSAIQKQIEDKSIQIEINKIKIIVADQLASIEEKCIFEKMAGDWLKEEIEELKLAEKSSQYALKKLKQNNDNEYLNLDYINLCNHVKTYLNWLVLSLYNGCIPIDRELPHQNKQKHNELYKKAYMVALCYIKDEKESWDLSIQAKNPLKYMIDLLIERIETEK